MTPTEEDLLNYTNDLLEEIKAETFTRMRRDGFNNDQVMPVIALTVYTHLIRDMLVRMQFCFPHAYALSYDHIRANIDAVLDEMRP